MTERRSIRPTICHESAGARVLVDGRSLGADGAAVAPDGPPAPSESAG